MARTTTTGKRSTKKAKGVLSAGRSRKKTKVIDVKLSASRKAKKKSSKSKLVKTSSKGEKKADSAKTALRSSKKGVPSTKTKRTASGKKAATSGKQLKRKASPDKKKSTAKKSTIKVSKAKRTRKLVQKKTGKTPSAPLKKSDLRPGGNRELSASLSGVEQGAQLTKAALASFRKANSKTKAQKKAKPSSRRLSRFLAKPPKTGKRYRMDLRVHSPGTLGYFSAGGIDPVPALVRLARVKDLDMIGVTDYHNAGYLDLVKEAAQDSKLKIIPGIDLRCRIDECDEVFVVALFPETHSSEKLFEVLEELKVPSEAYGSSKYCIEIPFEDVVRIIESHDGVLIPSRMDRTPYRRLAIRPLVEKYGLRAFDLVHEGSTDYFKEHWPDGEFLFFTFSNANALGQVGSRSARVKLADPGFSGLKKRLQRRT